jgi:hypothetical protein
MKKAGALASALRNSGATIPITHEAVHDAPLIAAEPMPAPRPLQPSRRQTKAITVHFPEEVRRQLKALAGEEGRAVEDMVAEALNLMFARYRKPEIAPVKKRQVT